MSHRILIDTVYEYSIILNTKCRAINILIDTAYESMSIVYQDLLNNEEVVASDRLLALDLTMYHFIIQLYATWSIDMFFSC